MNARLLLALVLAPGLAAASDVRLRADATPAAGGPSIQLSLTRGDGLETAEEPVAMDEIQRARARLGGEPVNIVDPTISGNAVRMSLPLPRAGVAVAGVELKPTLREIPERDFERELRSLHAGESLRAEWDAVPAPRRWREERRENAKTFVRRGEAPDRTWAEPLGFPLELVPLADPTVLRAGAEFAVQLLRGGAPLVGAVVVFVAGDEEREHVVVTDERGQASARLDVRGAWLVRASDLRAARAPELTWEREVTSLVLETR